ncbi:MAG: AMP-binding protein [Alphaproteobacteria bacterium]|nr:AMP-binding protein [Alphaproteobacteria bacterium]MCW5739498.1 AMP-binding protein [Alphaproteobacteria bacterium]
MISGERERSHVALAARAARAAGALKALGVGEDDSIALLLRNDLELFEANMAASLLGAYAVPINWHFTGEEAGYILSDSGAKALVAHADLLAKVRDAIPAGVKVLAVETPPEIAAAYAVGDEQANVPDGVTAWDDFLAAATPHMQPPPASRGSMIYTSGTTGKPKGVRRRPTPPEVQQSMMDQVAVVWDLRADPGTVVLMNGPMYHSAPAAYGMVAARLGLTIVLQPRFEAEDMLRLIDRHKVSHMHIVPTMFVRLLRLPQEVKGKYDVSSLRFLTHGAAPCAPAVKRGMIEWWGPVINEYYGATETGVVVWHTSEEALKKPGTVGRVVPGGILRIVDEQGRDVKQGEVGEIYLKAPGLSDFTYNNDDAKRRDVALGDLVTVGDVGYMDADGYVFLCDRKRDMIISGGVNIYPAEIESVLIQMPGVRDCAVFGIPDEEFGEAICAHIQPIDGNAIGAGDVRAYLAERLAKYKIPKVVEFTPELPREDSGKIFKRKLRQPYWEKAGRTI